MEAHVKQMIHRLKDEGYDCYIVGGYVRDYLLGIPSHDYDLCTNATPDILKEIFANYHPLQQYGTIKISFINFKVEITTYRKELRYYKRKPVQYLFTNQLKEDLNRRDFTINTICMDEDGQIIDLLDGQRDLQHKLIRCVQDIDKKLSEDPLRILRAIRFKAYLNFEIESELEAGIQKYKHLLKELSYERKKDEISHLIKMKRLDILKEYDIDQELELKLDNIKYYEDEILIWYTIDPNGNYFFNHYELKLIRSLKALLSSPKEPYDLYEAGKEVSTLCGKLLDIDLSQQYDLLPIKRRQDINVKCSLLIHLFPNQMVGKIYRLLEQEILSGRLPNQHDAIVSYLDKLKHTL